MKDYIVVDLETTGFYKNSEIIEIGALKVKDGNIVDKFSCLVKPKVGIPAHITSITGITNSLVFDADGIEEVLPAFYEFCGNLPLLAHNLSFDYRILKAQGELYGYDFTLDGKRTGVCTYKLSKSLFKKLKSHKLMDMVEFCEVPKNNSKFHRAEYDAYMCKCLYDVMLTKYGQIMGVSAPEILS